MHVGQVNFMCFVAMFYRKCGIVAKRRLFEKGEADVGKMFRKEGELLPKAGEPTPLQCSQEFCLQQYTSRFVVRTCLPFPMPAPSPMKNPARQPQGKMAW